MKILVLVKQVPDTATQVKVAGGGRGIDTTGITWIVSPYDEFAVEEALRIKEKRGQGPADEVVAVTLGPDRAKEALRSCLAMGADRAIHVNDPALATADKMPRKWHVVPAITSKCQIAWNGRTRESLMRKIVPSR